jgi:hypothetical protein
MIKAYQKDELFSVENIKKAVISFSWNSCKISFIFSVLTFHLLDSFLMCLRILG